jgi:hypothetical protein
MQFGPHQDAQEITAQLSELVRSGRVDEIMFFFCGEDLNDGHETLEQIQTWIERSRPYRQALTDSGVTLSCNPWVTLMHRDGHGRRLKPGQDWQTMVDQNGLQGEVTVCPLDAGWRHYYEEILRLYAREGFRVIWVEDDFRLHNHRPLDWGGCFCPLHVAEFNRRAGVTATREEIVACCTAPGEPHPWRALWLDMWDDGQLEIVSRWRQIVEAGGTRLGLMSSWPEDHSAEGRRWPLWWQALAGDKPPIHRPGFWGYEDMPGSALPHSIALLEQNRTLQPAGTESGPEIECFPYGHWNKSFRQTGAQMALAHILGATNLNISLYDFMGNLPDDEPDRAEFLRAWRPICDWLADTFPMSLRAVGVGLPWSPEMARRIHTDGSGKWQSLLCPSRGWADWLGATGHAFTMRPASSVNALAGPVVWSFSDEELRGWLAGGLLLDGMAAHILVERGLGDLIGVRCARFLTQEERLYTVENCLDADFALRVGAQMSFNQWAYSAQLFQGELAEGARVASDLRSPSQEVVGHGLVLYANSLGGQVAIVPWTANANLHINVQRAAQLNRILTYLDPEGTHGSISGGPWLVPQFLTDGSLWRGVIWNTGQDAVDEMHLSLPSGMPEVRSAVQVNARAERHLARLEGERLLLAQPLQAWEFVILE